MNKNIIGYRLLKDAKEGKKGEIFKFHYEIRSSMNEKMRIFSLGKWNYEEWFLTNSKYGAEDFIEPVYEN